MIKKFIILSLIICSFFLVNPHYGHSSNEDFFGKNKIKENLKGTTIGLSNSIESYVSYIITFLYFLTVIYGIWGGFQILKAGEDEEKVKKGKTVIIQGITGVVVIFLAGYIVGFFLGNADNGKNKNGLFTDNKIETGSK